jgi:Tfp pilus assembly protein PilF
MVSSDPLSALDRYQGALQAQALGDWKTALGHYGSLEAAGLGQPSIWFAHGIALQQAPAELGGSIKEALTRYEWVLQLEPQHAQAWLNRGASLGSLGRWEAAIESYSRAIELDTSLALAWFNRGVAFHTQGHFEAAIKDYLAALALRPVEASWAYNLADAWRALGALEQALAAYDQALGIDGNYAHAWCNRGVVLRSLGRFEAAIESFDRSINADPSYAEAYSNRGLALRDLQRIDAALLSFSRAIAIRPDYANAHLNQAFTRLLVGDYHEGFKQYEWRRLSSQAIQSAHPFTQPLWLGEPAITGKRLLVHAEQGLGDSLQFVRFVRDVARDAAEVKLVVPVTFQKLFSYLAPNIHVVTSHAEVDEVDYRIPMMSLAYALGCQVHSIPHAQGYLKPQPGTLALWTARLYEALGHNAIRHQKAVATPLLVGLVWRGRGQPNPLRNLSLEALLPFLPPQCIYVTLQPDLDPEEMAHFAPAAGDYGALQVRCAHLGRFIGDFEDTAALCSLMDVVISVDTSLAHLAGALGVRSLVLLPFSPDWRWGLVSDTTPWYASMRLLRQRYHGRWHEALEALALRLNALCPH